MDQHLDNFERSKTNPRPNTYWPNFAWKLTEITKFDLDTLKSLCKSMFDHWRKAENTDTNIGSNGDGSSLKVPRTTNFWESRQCLRPLGYEVNNFDKTKIRLLTQFQD